MCVEYVYDMYVICGSHCPDVRGQIIMSLILDPLICVGVQCDVVLYGGDYTDGGDSPVAESLTYYTFLCSTRAYFCGSTSMSCVVF